MFCLDHFSLKCIIKNIYRETIPHKALSDKIQDTIFSGGGKKSSVKIAATSSSSLHALVLLH